MAGNGRPKLRGYYDTYLHGQIHVDSATGEKHIADIKTVSELVIEFQHSAIQPTEVKCREAFYKNMVWVVDGTRPKRDYPRFCKGFSGLRPAGIAGFFRSSFPDECLPAGWLTSSVPVYFDFRGTNPIGEQDERRSAHGLIPSACAGKHAMIRPHELPSSIPETLAETAAADL